VRDHGCEHLWDCRADPPHQSPRPSYQGECAACVREERDALLEEIRRFRLDPFVIRCADRLADEVAALVRRRVIDSRSPAADALLDYREPPSTPRADRLAALEREVERLLAITGNPDTFEALVMANQVKAAEIAHLSAGIEAYRSRCALLLRGSFEVISPDTQAVLDWEAADRKRREEGRADG
jgi:hypothetical protein